VRHYASAVCTIALCLSVRLSQAGVLSKTGEQFEPFLAHKNVKASLTHYRALGPELIPVYKQLACRQVTISHPSGGRLPLLFTRPMVTFPAAESHHPLASTKLYCLVTEAHRCEQLAQGCYAALPQVGFEPTQVQRSTCLCHFLVHRLCLSYTVL